jgi:hypothetical protein
MTKEDYLRKKGRLPKENFGTIFTFTANREGVSPVRESLIWEILVISKESFHVDTSERKKSKLTRYSLRDSPYEVCIDENEIIGSDHGYGSGFGNLWGWSSYASFDRQALEIQRKAIQIEVNSKYGAKC